MIGDAVYSTWHCFLRVISEDVGVGYANFDCRR